MPSPLFDRTALRIKPLSERIHDLDRNAILDLGTSTQGKGHQEIKSIAQNMVIARKQGSSIILMLGGHVIRAGVQKFIMDLVDRGYINCLAMNGAGIIHDFEFSLMFYTPQKCTLEGKYQLPEIQKVDKKSTYRAH